MAFDAVSTTNGVNATSYSWGHTINAAANRKLIVAITVEEAGVTNPGDAVVSTVTYNGVNCTFRSAAIVRSAATANAELWDQGESNLPGSSGSYTVAVTHSGQNLEYNSGAISWDGLVDQAPEVKRTNTNTSGTTIADTFTTITDGALVVALGANGAGGTSTPDSGDERFDVSNSSAIGTLATEIVGAAGTHGNGFTFSAGSRSCIVLNAHEVASTGPTATLANTLADATSSAAAEVLLQATAANTLADVTSAGVAKVLLQATAANTLEDAVSAGVASGTVTSTATLANTLADATSSAAAAVQIQATAANTLADATSSSAAQVQIQATIAVTLADVTSAGVATVSGANTATLANTLEDAVSASAAAVLLQASAANTLEDAISAASASSGARTATIAVTLADATSAATAKVGISLNGANLLADATSALTATVADPYTTAIAPVIDSAANLHKGVLPKVETFEDVYDEFLDVHNAIDNLIDKVEQNEAAAPAATLSNPDSIFTTSVDHLAREEDGTILLKASSNAVTGYVPSAVGIAGKRYVFKSIDDTYGTWLDAIIPTEEIDGSTVREPLALQESITVQSDGFNWWII